jgi:sec-independent protein translocase protein TatB
MFDIGWGELVVIGIVALVVIGPKELPTVLRTVGQWMTKIRRMASEFQGQFQEAMREAEFADLKKQVDAISDPISSFTPENPLETAKQNIESAFEDRPNPPPAATTDTTGVSAASSMEDTPATATLPIAPDAGGEVVDPPPSSPTAPDQPSAPAPADIGGGKAA